MYWLNGRKNLVILEEVIVNSFLIAPSFLPYFFPFTVWAKMKLRWFVDLYMLLHTADRMQTWDIPTPNTKFEKENVFLYGILKEQKG